MGVVGTEMMLNHKDECHCEEEEKAKDLAPRVRGQIEEQELNKKKNE